MDVEVLFGPDSVIHGWNPALRNNGGNTRFDAFDMAAHGPARPVSFRSLPVAGTLPILLDHQGHIIPQNLYSARLLAIATALDNAMQVAPIYDLAAAQAWLVLTYPALNFTDLNNYINNRLIAAGGAVATSFVDPAGNDIEERVGGYFSVINWNPVNICRAPSDNHRAGYPGNAPDSFVALKLLTNPNAAGITLPGPYAAFLLANLQNFGAGTVPDDFIAATNACLPGFPQGFYQFPWSTVLGPQL